MNDFDHFGRSALHGLTNSFGVRGHASKQRLHVKVTQGVTKV